MSWFYEISLFVIGAVAVSSAISLYLLAVAIDTFRFYAAFKQVGPKVGGRASKSRKRLGDRYFLTTIGAKLASYLEAYQYRLEALEWERSAPVPELHSLELFAADSSITSGGQEQIVEQDPQILLSRLTARLISVAKSSFRSSACACLLPIAVREGAANSKTRAVETGIWAYGVSGAKWENQLFAMLQGWFEHGDRGGMGLRDARLDRSFLFDLSGYGFPTFLLLPVEWSEQSSDGQGSDVAIVHRGALWLGYRSGERPLEVEIERANELAKQLERELQSISLLSKLSGRIGEFAATSQQKSDFLNQMSHDIRSPLNNIRAILTLLGLDRSVDKEGEMIKVALQNCESLSEIVEDVLDFSRHSAGKLVAVKESVNLELLVSGVAEAFSVTAESKGLSLHAQVDVKANGARSLCDKRQVKRILSNLISNAIKYTAAGSINVELKAQNGWYEIAVRDTGCGMTADQLAELFTPFSRFESGDKRLVGVEGVGLGLYISRLLAHLNGASLEVESEHGKGTVFRLLLEQSAEGANLEDNSTPNRQVPDSILVVDDDPDAVNSMARTLTRMGWQVEKAFGVKEACKLIREKRPSLIISDDQMPDGGARRILNELNGLSKTNQHHEKLPRLAVLSGSADERLDELRQIGAEQIFTKPVDFDELNRWLGSDKGGGTFQSPTLQE